MSEPQPQPASPPLFAERPTALLVEDAYRFGAIAFAASAFFGILGWTSLAVLLFGLGVFVGAFFRNPERVLPGDEAAVVSPADGRVIEVGTIEGESGEKVLRVGIFLSVFNVHVNRAPLAGRVVEVRRSGNAYLAAFNREAETRNVRTDLVLATASGARVVVSQITGLIARRIVCHPEPGDWLGRGVRYGLIRFGSRTDVQLPLTAEVLVSTGDRVRGGETVIARFDDVAEPAE
jgi:phosphatidylserine decarboxylase